MFEEAPAAVPKVVELDDLLLDAKLSAPEPRRGSVSRRALIDTARASGRRAVDITAPAGYGKSTLMSEWAAREDRPVAWVSLDRFDDDPTALLILLASAYGRVDPAHADLAASMRAHGLSTLGRSAPLLASVFRAARMPFVLMLDDLHELRSVTCHDVLGIVLGAIPEGSQVVTASRGEQPHVPRLRAAGDALDITSNDLVLDAAGAKKVFAKAGLIVDGDVAASIVTRTEGWPVGVFLAAAIARDGGGDALSVSGDDRYVADYLYREALANQPDHVQRFLRRTAVLDTFSAPLCDTLLDGTDAQEILRDLEASGMFLVPLDRHREWFRYHSLFREFLLGELRRVDPDAMRELHLRAARWFEANGSPGMAIEHLLDTNERAKSTHLVAALALPTYQAGQVSTVQRWLAALGEPAIRDYPPLAVVAGWLAALTGHSSDADRWAAMLENVSYDREPADDLPSFESGRAMLRVMMCARGPEHALRDARYAVATEPTWSAWRDQALCLEGEAELLLGDVLRAEAAFAEASAAAVPMGNTDVLILSEAERALLAMDAGNWADAADHVGTALDSIEAQHMHDYATAVLAFAAAARLAMHRGDLHDANRQLTRAMRARPACTYVLPFLAVRVRLQLAKVYWAMGDDATAQHLMREIDDVLLMRPALGVLADEAHDFRATMSARGPTPTGGPPLTPAELRLLPYLQTHLSIREIGERLFISRNTVSSEVGSIYRKLGVSARSEAVERALAMGLLGA